MKQDQLCDVHCNNLYTKSVKIFHRVECYFKQQLVANWERESVGVTTVMDDKNPSARFVVVPLGQRLGSSPPHNISRPINKVEDSNTSILIGCLVTIILLLLLIIIVILWRQHWKRILEKAPRRILEEDATVRPSLCNDTIVISNQTQIFQTNPTYERVFPFDLEYQEPARLLRKLPELSQSAEDSGKEICHSYWVWPTCDSFWSMKSNHDIDNMGFSD
eukprot:g42895.t1